MLDRAVAVMALVHASRQTEANQRISRLAVNLEERGQALESSLALSNSRLARLDLERGQAAFDRGQIGAGMLWTVRRSNAIIALRCSKLSGRFQDFWERRSERRAA